jgi:hypothetical protein
MTDIQAALPRFEALPAPTVELKRRSRIRFLHPGYPTGTNTLLTLPRVDPVAVADATATTITAAFGVHYGTAFVACQIIAGNAFNTGRFTLDAAGLQPVDVLFDSILTGEVYYFVIDGSPGMSLPAVLLKALTDPRSISNRAEFSGLGVSAWPCPGSLVSG